MTIYVARNDFDPAEGFQYYVAFKPMREAEEDPEVSTRVPVQAAVSVTENGDLADVTFELPKACRSDLALSFIRGQENAQYVAPRVFVAMPELSGDAVVSAPARLELDAAGRIIGMEIQWMPAEAKGTA